MMNIVQLICTVALNSRFLFIKLFKMEITEKFIRATYIIKFLFVKQYILNDTHKEQKLKLDFECGINEKHVRTQFTFHRIQITLQFLMKGNNVHIKKRLFVLL